MDATQTVGWIALASALCMGLAVLGGAYGQGRMTAAALESIGRNPTNAGAQVRTALFVALAMTESLVLFALMIAFQLQAYVGTMVKAAG